MNEATKERMFGTSTAFEEPVTLGFIIATAALIVVATVVNFWLGRSGRVSDSMRTELRERTRSWVFIALGILVPVVLGAAWTMIAVGILSVVCYREFARATGIFRHPWNSFLTVVAIVFMTLASLDHWYGLFAALPALGVVVLVALAVLQDQPKGYIQRVGLSVLGFLLFGVCFAHLGYIANDPGYRPIVLLIILCVALNDIFAFITGKLFGKRKVFPNTSPNKTLGGALGALILTTALAAWLGHLVFEGTTLDTLGRLIGLGLVLSIAGQLGDLVLSSIKRDLGIKDMGNTIPGHGGFMDRFDSLLLAAPAVFHYIGYFRGFGLDQATRIFTGGGAG